MKTYAERKQRTPHTLVGHVGNSKQASLCEILQSSHDKLLERKAIQCQINNNSPGTKIKDELKIPSVNNFVPIQRYATFTEGGKFIIFPILAKLFAAWNIQITNCMY